MRASDVYKSKYLKSDDVKSRPLTCTISHVEVVSVGTGKEAKDKPVLNFEGDTLPMVLNRTNWDALEEAFGDSDDWPGHRVKVRTARTQYQGKSVDGIRLEPIKPKPAPKTVDEDLDDEIPV